MIVCDWSGSFKLLKIIADANPSHLENEKIVPMINLD